MSIEKAFLVQKLNQMKEYLAEAEPFLELSQQDILKEMTILRTLERLLQLIVDQALDINKHFIKEFNLKISDDLQGTFVVIGEHNILPIEFAKKIAPVVGLRNQLVYRYEKIDNKRFIKDFKNNKSDFEKYMKYIFIYLEKNVK